MRQERMEGVARWLEVATICERIAEELRVKLDSLRKHLKEKQFSLVKATIEELVVYLREELLSLHEVGNVLLTDELKRDDLPIKTCDFRGPVFLLEMMESTARRFGKRIREMADSENCWYGQAEIETTANLLRLDFSRLQKALASEKSCKEV